MDKLVVVDDDNRVSFIYFNNEEYATKVQQLMVEAGFLVKREVVCP